eukprot:g33270.t1
MDCSTKSRIREIPLPVDCFGLGTVDYSLRAARLQTWAPLLQGFVSERRALGMVCHLVSCEQQGQLSEGDEQLVEIFQKCEKERVRRQIAPFRYVVILTKTDLASSPADVERFAEQVGARLKEMGQTAITCCLDLDRRAITLGLRVLDVSVGGLWGRNLRVLRGRTVLISTVDGGVDVEDATRTISGEVEAISSDCIMVVTTYERLPAGSGILGSYCIQQGWLDWMANLWAQSIRQHLVGQGRCSMHRAVLVLLVRSCTGLFFELKAQSAGPAECFKELFRNASPSGKFSIEVTEESPHSLCFTSVAEESQMVSFNFHVDEHGDGSHHDKEHMEYVTKEHTDRVEELLPFFFRCSFARRSPRIFLAMSVGRCLQQLELALHYDARSLMVLQQTSPSMRKALQEGLLEVFCKLVRQPVAGHNLTGAIWKLACFPFFPARSGPAQCWVLGCGIDGPWFERSLREAVEGLDQVLRPCDKVAAAINHETAGEASTASRHVRSPTDDAVVAFLVPCLEDADIDIRTAAVDALRRVALHGDPATVRGASMLLEHRDGSVRAGALRTLSWVARVGDAEVMAKAKSCLEDGVSNVRAAALHAMAELVTHKGDVDVIARVVGKLSDSESFVRGAALESLLKVADQGDATAVPAVLELLEHPDGRVRLAAVEALGQVAPKNDASIISTVAELMEDRHTGVCCVAVQVLGHLGAGDAQCRQLLLQRRYDAEAAQPVRAAAAYVLEEGGFEIAGGPKNTQVIDNSSAWRYDEDKPLVIPEINGEGRVGEPLIANPNCTTAVGAMALWPIHQKYKLKKVLMSTYQAASGAGAEGMAELENGLATWVKDGAVPKPEFFAHQLPFNVIPQIDKFQENGYTKEEMKVTWDPDDVRELLKSAPGVKVVDEPGSLKYPMPLNATGNYDVEVGRIRQSIVFGEKGIEFFVSGDQLLRGAALNAVIIAENAVKAHA